MREGECCQLVGGTPTRAVETTALPICNCIVPEWSCAYPRELTAGQPASLRQFGPRTLSQLAHLGHQNVLCSRRKESLRRIEPSAFITAFFQHAGRREISKDIIAIGGDPELKRSNGLFHQRHVVHDDLAG